MKTMKQITLSMGLILVAAGPAMAEAGARQDNSMLLVYLFLATCGLIIFLQLIPVFTMVFAMVRGLFGKRHSEAKPVPVKNR
jgi:TctA family transporter